VKDYARFEADSLRPLTNDGSLKYRARHSRAINSRLNGTRIFGARGNGG